MVWDPSDFLLDELKERKRIRVEVGDLRRIKNDIAFHFRLLDMKISGLKSAGPFDKLSEREIKVVDVRLDKEDGYGRLAHLDLKRAVDDDRIWRRKYSKLDLTTL